MKLKDRFNKKYMQISMYVIITCVIIYSLTRVADNATIITREIAERLGWLLEVTKPVILGFAFAYLMDPVVSFFESKFRKLKIFKKIKNPRTWASVLSVAILIAAVAGLISMLVFSVTNQIRLANFDDIIKLGEEFMDSLNGFIASIRDKMSDLNIESDELEQYIQNVTVYLTNMLTNIAGSTVNSLRNISGYLTSIIFSFIIGFYFMIDGRMFMNYIKKVFHALFSDNANHKLTNMVHDLDHVFSGYIRGQLTDAFVMMILISLVLSITGVKFAIVIGIFAGIGNLIPYFGPIVAYVATTIVCLINGDMKTLVAAIIALVVIQFVDGNLIGPKLLSRSIKIHPLIIIVSLIFGSAIGGFLGMLLAVPVGAYLKLVFMRFIERRTKRKEELKKEAQANSIKIDGK